MVPYAGEMTPTPLATIDGYGWRRHLSCIANLSNAAADNDDDDVADAELNWILDSFIME